MTEVYAIVECKITYKDGSIERRSVLYTEISAGLASVDKVSVLNYLQTNSKNVERIEFIDTLFFRNKAEFEKYLKTMRT